MMRRGGLRETVVALIIGDTTGAWPLVIVLVRQGFLDTARPAPDRPRPDDGLGHELRYRASQLL